MSPPNTNPSIFQPPRQDTDSECVPRLLGIGTPGDLSIQQELPPESGCTISNPSHLQPGSHLETPNTQGERLSTLEYPVPNRNLIWNARSSFCQRNSPNIKLYETSVRELIGQDPDLKPFFDTAWTDRYERSWLPTETGCQDSGLSYSSLLLKRQEGSSWFSANLRQNRDLTSSVLSPSWERTSCQSFTFSRADITEGESTRPKKEKENQQNQEENQTRPKKRRKVSEVLNQRGKVMRSRKVRIRPTQEQREVLKKCFGVHRYIYNECVNAENRGLIHGSSVSECSRWRTLLTKKQNYYDLGNHWKDECPSHTKQQAVEEFFKNKKTGVKMVCEGNLKKFKINFKSRFKSTQETIPFERYSFRKTGQGRGCKVSIPYQGKPMDLHVMGKVPKEFRDRDDINSIRKEIKISRTRLGKYYAYITFEVEQTPRFEGDVHGDMVSFDPGSKTFLTYHSPDGTWGEIGTFEEQEKLLKKADNLRSKLDIMRKTKGSRWRRRTKRLILGLFEKVRNRTADLHNKVCSWVVNTYRIILLPIFETKQMVSAKKLHSTTCRKMMTWSHYKFQRKLVDLAQKYMDVKVRLCNEAFTTKQCGRCGVVNWSMTLNDRVFNCSSCGLQSSRDGHAARNVGLRSLKFLIDS